MSFLKLFLFSPNQTPDWVLSFLHTRLALDYVWHVPCRTCPSVLFFVTSCLRADGVVLSYFSTFIPGFQWSEMLKYVESFTKMMTVAKRVYFIKKHLASEQGCSCSNWSSTRPPAPTTKLHMSVGTCFCYGRISVCVSVCACLFMLLLIWRIHWFINE